MKNLFLILSIVTCLASCKSDESFLAEDPKGQLFQDNFLRNVTELELVNNSMYTMFDRALFVNYESMEIKMASADDILGTGNQRSYYNEMEVNLDISAGGDSDMKLGWERCFNAINQANYVINNYHNADGVVKESTLNEYAAQAHFVRAFIYFWVVRFFNNVPLVTTAYEFDAKKEVTVAPAREVYDLIVSDLLFAEKWLPVKWAGDKHKGGAFTKGAASAVLAKVYLQMAGFPINGGTEYYAKARDKAKEIIDRSGEYGYVMFDHYHQIWDPYRKAWDNAVEEAILYTNHSVNHTQWRAPCPSRPVELDGWESMVAEAGFYNRFPEGERKEFTFITDFYKSTGEHLHYTELVSRHPFYRKWYADDLTPGWEWETRDEPTSKWRSGMELRMSWNCGRQVYILRYPDILLTYAEAKARTDGPDDLAYKCLNDVRNRAFKGVGSAEASLSGLSTAAFIDSVVWERAYEFCGFEFSARWFDLQRLELVEKANTEWRQETEEKYILRKPYTKKDYFLAIPSKEVQLNPNLANNNSEF